MKAWFLRLHRWLALAFALPLAVVLATGLVLSFEPWLVERAIVAGALTPAKIEALLARHDPGGDARAIAYRSYDNTLTIGARGRGGTVVDVATEEARPGPSGMANFLVSARRLHETLLIDAGWLVIAATAVMLVLALLGVLMGWPRIRNTLAGWHKAMAWGLLPLIVLSPLSGIFMASGVTLAGPPPAAATAPAPRLPEAVRVLGQGRDLAALVWLRPMGGRLLARIIERGEYRLYAVTKDGAVALPRNWPRLWHEGNFAPWAAWMNVIVSAAMIGLLATGPWLWLRRKLRGRASRLRRAVAA